MKAANPYDTPPTDFAKEWLEFLVVPRIFFETTCTDAIQELQDMGWKYNELSLVEHLWKMGKGSEQARLEEFNQFLSRLDRCKAEPLSCWRDISWIPTRSETIFTPVAPQSGDAIALHVTFKESELILLANLWQQSRLLETKKGNNREITTLDLKVSTLLSRHRFNTERIY